MNDAIYNIDTRAEDLVLELVAIGVFEVDRKGRIWRIGTRKKKGAVVPCKRRRAEYPATNGYLRLRVSVCGIRIRVSAHRIVYRHFNGPIPAGYVVDHKGRGRDDNRPHMLEAVTQSVNTLRGIARAA